MTSLQCRINLAAKVAYAMGPALSRAPRSLWGSFFSFSCWRPLLFFVFAYRFLSQGRKRDSPNGGVCVCVWGGGGGGRRCKHWPPALETLATPLPVAGRKANIGRGTGVGTGGGGKGGMCPPLFRVGGKDMFVPPPLLDPEFRDVPPPPHFVTFLRRWEAYNGYKPTR